jgi:hypothetical protein
MVLLTVVLPPTQMVALVNEGVLADGSATTVTVMMLDHSIHVPEITLLTYVVVEVSAEVSVNPVALVPRSVQPLPGEELPLVGVGQLPPVQLNQL